MTRVSEGVVAVKPCWSVTTGERVKDPVVWGIPERVPFELIVSPAGKGKKGDSLTVYGAVPPAKLNLNE